MLNSKTEALGIIFPNSYDAMVPDLVSERLMASIPFASRYRMCDFILSSMVHSGIDNISISVKAATEICHYDRCKYCHQF